MNNDLIKRIDESFFFVVDADGQQKLNRLLEDCRAEIERKATYVPMTDDELWASWKVAGEPNLEQIADYRATEAAVIKRAGLEIKHETEQ